MSLIPCAWVLAALKRSPYTPWQSLWYFVNVVWTRVLWRVEVPGQLPVPAGQGAVIVANHRSSVDPCFIQLAAGRVVHWMIAREYFEIPLVGLFLRTTQAIPTRRTGHDTAATRAAIRYASRGDLVGMMPEGRLNVTDHLLLPARPGAAMVALTARVPIVPCFIDGAPGGGSPWTPLWRPARVRVVFGSPMDLTAYHDRGHEPGVLGELTLQLMKEIARLAGNESFQPRLAGRRWLGNEAEPLDA